MIFLKDRLACWPVRLSSLSISISIFAFENLITQRINKVMRQILKCYSPFLVSNNNACLENSKPIEPKGIVS